MGTYHASILRLSLRLTGQYLSHTPETTLITAGAGNREVRALKLLETQGFHTDT
jgi:hypothetical protein